MGEIDFANGRYVGEIANGKPHGIGKFIWNNNKKLDYYEGSFSNGLTHGSGKLSYKDGTTREGIFAFGGYIGIVEKYNKDTGNSEKLSSIDQYPQGYVRIIHKNLDGSFDYYLGNWYKGLRHGYGKYTHNNEIQEGVFYKHKFIAKSITDQFGHPIELQNGTYSGNVTIVYPNDEVYTGFWRDGYRDGYGKYLYEDGDIYEGYWKNGLRHTPEYKTSKYYSKGTNTEYVGEFKNDLFEGEGRIQEKGSQSFFKGHFKKGRKSGKGLQYYFRIGMCESNWVDGFQSGIQHFSFEEMDDVPEEINAVFDKNNLINGQLVYNSEKIHFENEICDRTHENNIKILYPQDVGSTFGKRIFDLVSIFETGVLGITSQESLKKLLDLANGGYGRAKELKKAKSPQNTYANTNTPNPHKSYTEQYRDLGWSSSREIDTHTSCISSRGCDTSSYLVWD